ncbi:hypothetical protein H0H87_006045 [Tephrocybe sp. NHM501043]|nr:hypothetical protein H0H87_006045 [Tephrocybe sp. NHM501043]
MTSIFGINADDIEVVTKDGAPHGIKDFLVWNPTYIDEKVPSLGRHSSVSEATNLMRFLMKRGVRVILFCKDRRQIEQDAFNGRLLGIVATNALELGVDIGALDAVIMLGFPITLASFTQQAGRAGRRSRDSVAILVADSFPVDQHYVEHPHELFDTSNHDLIIDLESRPLLEAHLQCAAQEMPLSSEDGKYFGALFKEICESHLVKDEDGCNINAVKTYRIKEIKDSTHRAYYGKVDVEVKVFGFFKIRNKVILEAVDLDTPAWQRETTGYWIDVPKALLVLFRTKGINPAEAIHAAQHAILNRFSMSQDLRTECKAAEKEYKAVLETKRKRPARLIFYDTIDKGGGVAAKAFDNVNDLLRKGCSAIEACGCNEGCTECKSGPKRDVSSTEDIPLGVQSSACKEGNLVCSKLGAHLVLKCLLGLEIDPDNIPLQGEGLQDLETVVEAETVRAIESVRVESS